MTTTARKIRKPQTEPAAPKPDHAALLEQFPAVCASLSILDAQNIPYELVPQPPKVRVGHLLFDAGNPPGAWRSDYDTAALPGRSGRGVRALIAAYREDTNAIERASQQDEEARARAIEIGKAGYAAVEEELNHHTLPTDCEGVGS